MSSRSRQFNTSAAHFVRWNVSALRGLGDDAPLAIFARKTKPSERRTLDEWQAGLQNGSIGADYTKNGVRYARVIAYGTNKPGTETVIPEQVQDSALANDIFKYGDTVPHRTMGVMYVPKYIFDANKSAEQMQQEGNQPVTLSCTLGSKGTDCSPSAFPPFFQCTSGGAIVERLTDAQASGLAKSKGTDITCYGAKGSPREQHNWIVHPDGTIGEKTIGPPPKPGDVFCPAANFPEKGVVTSESNVFGSMGAAGTKPPGEIKVTLAEANQWMAAHHCEEMVCRDAMTSAPKRFYYCPEAPTTTQTPALANVMLFGGIGLAIVALFFGEKVTE